MKAVVLCVFVLGAWAACGGDSGGNDGTAGNDIVADAKPGADNPGADGLVGAFTCWDALDCTSPCADQPCVDACTAKITTGAGKGLFEALANCGLAACPGDAGGPCADEMSEACGQCWEAAFGNTCKAQADACKGDGGTAPVGYGCEKAMACMQPCQDNPCIDACKDKIDTPNGKTLVDAVLGCGNTACSGSCSDPSAKDCIDCWEAAFSGACKTQMAACESD